ncbi:MAG: hypothetical protein Q4A16_04240 [Lautropia sp.]|nr:hypothetical protein [Lautropia sp.]
MPATTSSITMKAANQAMSVILSKAWRAGMLRASKTVPGSVLGFR